jgi:vancomycin resistance protein YoaR
VPTIEITKRYPHSEWLVPYYSDYVFGDDAALYQMSKQLEIKNIGSDEMYFKVLEKGNGNYFVIITPKKTNK